MYVIRKGTGIWWQRSATRWPYFSQRGCVRLVVGLVWQWLREDKGNAWGLCGAVVLILYGIIPTFQPAHFGRVYAAYGGVFIVLSLF